MLYACYLPPENSVWGNDPNTFYAHLRTELCMHNEADAVIFCGDFNGRIGNMADIGINVDVEIANTTSIDRIKMRMVMLWLNLWLMVYWQSWMEE